MQHPAKSALVKLNLASGIFECATQGGICGCVLSSMGYDQNRGHPHTAWFKLSEQNTLPGGSRHLKRLTTWRKTSSCCLRSQCWTCGRMSGPRLSFQCAVTRRCQNDMLVTCLCTPPTSNMQTIPATCCDPTRGTCHAGDMCIYSPHNLHQDCHRRTWWKWSATWRTIAT